MKPNQSVSASSHTAGQDENSNLAGSLREGRPIYCNRACAGLARRLVTPPTEAERKAAKKAYDAEYRMRDVEARKAAKAEYYQRTRDPVKEREIRKARMHLHLEYCRRPEYVAWKAEYDRQYKARLNFGEFADAFLLLTDIDKEIAAQATRYEIYQANGTLNKAQTRRRSL